MLNPPSALGFAQRVDRSRPPASQFTAGPLGGQGPRGALPGRGCRRGGLKRSWRESRCQAAIGSLRASADLAAVALPLDVAVEAVPGLGPAPAGPGRRDRRPAQAGRAGLREPAAAGALPRPPDARGQPRVAHQLARGSEARELSDLDREAEPQARDDAGDRLEQLDAAVRAGGSGSRSSGAGRRSRWSTSASASKAERRHTSGTPWDRRSSTASGSRRRDREGRRPHWPSSPKLPFLAEERERIGCGRRLSRSPGGPAQAAMAATPPAPDRGNKAWPSAARRACRSRRPAGPSACAHPPPLPASRRPPAGHPGRPRHRLDAGPGLRPRAGHEPHRPVLVRSASSPRR